MQCVIVNSKACGACTAGQPLKNHKFPIQAPKCAQGQTYECQVLKYFQLKHTLSKDEYNIFHTSERPIMD